MKNNSQESTLTPRDRLLRDSFTQAEIFLTGLLVVSSIALLHPGQPRSYWLLGFFLIIGSLVPVALKTHELNHPFFIDYLWSRYLYLSAPFWLLLVCFLIGSFQSPTETVILENTEYQILKSINPWLPTTTKFGSAWICLLAYGCMHMLCITLFIIPKSLAYFERVLPVMCLIATLVCVFGYMQKIAGSTTPFYAYEHATGDYFSIFAYDGHWAAYALLWMTVCFTFALRQLEYEGFLPLSETTIPWYLSGGLLLGYSGLFLKSAFPSAILLLFFSGFAFIFTVSYLRSKRSNKDYRVAVFALLLGTIAVTNAIIRLIKQAPYDLTAQGLRQSAWRMFCENPLFGWGIDSFSHLAPFYQSDLLLNEKHERAFSEINQILAEFGLIGTLPIILALLIPLIRYFRGQHDFIMSNMLLSACAGVLIIALFDTPFMSPAVFFSFLTLFFSALRWGDLARKRVDEVDSKTVVVVTHSSKRGVPVYTGPKNERFK